MSGEIQLSSGLPLFEPRSRYAILLNNYYTSEQYSPTDLCFRGNRHVYKLEALLAGRFGRGPEKFEPVLGERLQLTFGHKLVLHQQHRQGIKYNSVLRILPWTAMEGEFDRCIERIANESSDETLIFVYLMSHGKRGSFEINLDREEMNYQHLLKRLDGIKGKKVVVALACYSGSLIDACGERKTKHDYIILTSTANEERGFDVGEYKLYDILVENLLTNGKVSRLRIPTAIGFWPNHIHHPQIVGSYDVRL